MVLGIVRFKLKYKIFVVWFRFDEFVLVWFLKRFCIKLVFVIRGSEWLYFNVLFLRFLCSVRVG